MKTHCRTDQEDKYNLNDICLVYSANNILFIESFLHLPTMRNYTPSRAQEFNVRGFYLL